MKLRLFIALTFIPIFIFAEDITTIKGNKYTEVVVQRIEPDGISIKHSAGFGKLYFSELPPETRIKYGYDPAKHKKYYEMKQRQIANADTLRTLDSISISVEATLSQVLDSGSLAYIQIIDTYVITNTYTDTHSGSKVSYNPLTRGSTKMPSGSQGSVVRSKTDTIYNTREIKEPVFILGISSGYVDGDKWHGRLYPIGSYSYTTVQDAPKKVKKYTISRSEALNYYKGVSK
jgi:hypothetical protein